MTECSNTAMYQSSNVKIQQCSNVAMQIRPATATIGKIKTPTWKILSWQA